MFWSPCCPRDSQEPSPAPEFESVNSLAPPSLGSFVMVYTWQLAGDHLPVQEMWVWSLSQEDPLEKEMATHSGILAWKIPRTEEPSRLETMELQRVGHDWATSLSLSFTLYCLYPFHSLLLRLSYYEIIWVHCVFALSMQPFEYFIWTWKQCMEH